ncbi:MAG: hypothetical protein JXR05_08060 [Flavobacteriaceae bacterium]
MKGERKQKIANSFPEKFEEAEIDVELTKEEFLLFENGFFARFMEEKWNIFIFEELLYFARSWTDTCIYQVNFLRHENGATLKKIRVSRNSHEYESTDIKFDLELFDKVLKFYMKPPRR